MEVLPVTIPERVAEGVLAYYRQADTLPALAQDLLAWYLTLAPEAQHAVAVISLENAARLPCFRRYALEKRGYLMEQYLADHLTAAELRYWLAGDDSRLGP